jgi:hypothetical protein
MPGTMPWPPTKKARPPAEEQPEHGTAKTWVLRFGNRNNSIEPSGVIPDILDLTCLGESGETIARPRPHRRSEESIRLLGQHPEHDLRRPDVRPAPRHPVDVRLLEVVAQRIAEAEALSRRQGGESGVSGAVAQDQPGIRPVPRPGPRSGTRRSSDRWSPCRR